MKLFLNRITCGRTPTHVRWKHGLVGRRLALDLSPGRRPAPFKRSKRRGAPALVLAILVIAGSAAAAEFTVLTREHTDFRILYTPGETNLLRLAARDEDRRVNHATNEVILVVGESSRLTLPPGTPFGDAGQPFWILPQSQNVNLLYLGMSAEGIPSGVFEGPLTVALKRFEGPGYFMVWQATGPGQFNIRLNTRDGLNAADTFTPGTGSHEHFNWGFSTAGVYCLTFQVTGRRVGEATNLISPECTFAIHVLPLPPPTNFLVWQKHFWPPGFHPPTTSPESDPDGDGVANLLEYAAGTVPTNAVSAGAGPALSFVETGGQRFGAISFERHTAAHDLDFTAEAGSVLSSGWQPLTTLLHSEPLGPATRRVRFRDDVPATNDARRFYRLKAGFR